VASALRASDRRPTAGARARPVRRAAVRCAAAARPL